MAIKLGVYNEQSTGIVEVDFSDSTGAAATPKLASWTLKDEDGAIINGRDAVNIDTPKATETVVLTGLDLALPDPKKPYRYLLIEAVYDSVLYGNDLNLREEGKLKIVDLKAKV